MMGITSAAAKAADTAARIRSARSLLGASASKAVGADIPRPAPQALAPPPKDAMFLPARQQLTPAQVNALIRKAKKEGLTVEEAYWLTEAGALPDSALKQLDNVETSAVPLDIEVTGKDNLTPNKTKGPTPAEKKLQQAKDELFGLTGPSDGEAISSDQVKKTLKRLDKILSTEEGKTAFYDLVGKNTADPEGAVKDANSRIDSLRSMIGQDPAARDAGRIDAAEQNRAAAGKPRPQAANPVVAQQIADTTRAMAANEIPDNIQGLAEAFNNLPEDVRAEVAARVAKSNPYTTRMFAGEGGTVSISPNAVSVFSQPRSKFEQLIHDLETARSLGDPEMEDALKADIRREMDAMAAEDPNAPQEAIKLYQERRDAQDSLRREIIAARPDVQSDVSAARAASVSPGQPPVRAPGSRSVEVSGPPLTDAEMPTSFDDALARMREQLFESQARPSAPVTRAEVDRINDQAGLKEGARPLALTPRLEDRSISSRGGVTTSEQSAIEELNAAQAAFDAAKTPEEKIAAGQRLLKANTKVNRTFGGSKPSKTKDAEGDTQFVEGKARSDSSLNRPSQAQTYRDLIDTIAGYRQRGEKGLARPDVEFSALERDRMANDAQAQLGYDKADTSPTDMMPTGGDLEDLEMLGEGGKRGRLGGRQRPSRVAAAMEQLFGARRGKDGSVNPLDKQQFPEFDGDPQKVADFLMRRPENTRVEGTADWQMTRDDLAAAIGDHFGPAAGRSLGEEAAKLPSPASGEAASVEGTTQNVTQVPNEQGTWPEGTLRQTSERGPSPRENVAGTPPAPAARKDFSQPETVLTPEEESLKSSAVELGDSSPASKKGESLKSPAVEGETPATGAAPAKGSKGGASTKSPPVSEGDDEMFFGKPKSAWRSAWNGWTQNGRKAEITFDEYWDIQTGKRSREEVLASRGTAAASPPVAGETPATAAAASGGGGGKKPPKNPKNTDSTGSPPLEGADTPAGGKPKKNVTAKDEKKPQIAAEKKDPKSDPSIPKKDRTLSQRLWDNKGKVAIGLGVLGGLYGMSQSGGSGVAGDLNGQTPVPPGAGAGGEAGSPSEEDAITRALEMIRGSRRGPDSPSYQTLQNWTVWR